MERYQNLLVRRFRVGILGTGNSASYHFRTLTIYQKLFEIKLLKLTDFPLEIDDCSAVVISITDTKSKNLLLKKCSNYKGLIIIEKPIVTDYLQLEKLAKIINLNKPKIYGCFHPLFSPLLTKAKELAKTINPEQVQLIRRQPNYINNVISSFIKENSTGYDTWYNNMSELASFDGTIKIQEVSTLDNRSRLSYPEANTLTKGKVGKLSFNLLIDWESPTNEKSTEIIGTEGKIRINYTKQIITLTNLAGQIQTYNFDSYGDRVLQEYIRMYQNIYDVLCNFSESNTKLIAVICKNVLLIQKLSLKMSA